MDLVIDPAGQIRCVYGEAIELRLMGSLKIRRGSHVEPSVDGKWTADLAPVNGPVLGPFSSRSAALAAEYKWLREHWLIPCS